MRAYKPENKPFSIEGIGSIPCKRIILVRATFREHTLLITIKHIKNLESTFSKCALCGFCDEKVIVGSWRVWEREAVFCEASRRKSRNYNNSTPFCVNVSFTINTDRWRVREIFLNIFSKLCGAKSHAKGICKGEIFLFFIRQDLKNSIRIACASCVLIWDFVMLFVSFKKASLEFCVKLSKSLNSLRALCNNLCQ